MWLETKIIMKKYVDIRAVDVVVRHIYQEIYDLTITFDQSI